MKQFVFAVYDSKSEMFNQPMFFKAKGEALRAFTDEANRPDSAIFKHPGDYTLFLIGDYNIDTGLLTPMPSPISLGLGLEYQQVQEQTDFADLSTATTADVNNLRDTLINEGKN